MQNKKLIISPFLISFLIVVAFASKTSGLSTLNYGYITLTSSGAVDSGHFGHKWNLAAGDMVLSFTYDSNGLVDDSGCHAWAAFGVRALGYGDFNPTWGVEGAGVWLATDFDWNTDTFEGDADDNSNGVLNKDELDLDDKLLLQKAGGNGEGDYNLPSVPPVPGNNHRFWWDRDGVDPWQNDETANTGGIYQIVITLHATSTTTGEAYMTIRGLAQGFETDGDWSTIELTPAGMTFTFPADTCVQVYYGLYGYGATHSVTFKDIRVTGTLCEAVGGEWMAVNKVELLAPWIGLASLITVATASIIYVKHRKKQQD